jgi:hypothetical protein
VFIFDSLVFKKGLTKAIYLITMYANLRRWDNRGKVMGEPGQNYKLSLIAFRISRMNEKEVRN